MPCMSVRSLRAGSRTIPVLWSIYDRMIWAFRPTYNNKKSLDRIKKKKEKKRKTERERDICETVMYKTSKACSVSA